MKSYLHSLTHRIVNPQLPLSIPRLIIPSAGLESWLYNLGVEPTENAISNNFSIVARLFVSAGTFCKSFPSNEFLLWLHYSGLQASRHSIIPYSCTYFPFPVQFLTSSRVSRNRDSSGGKRTKLSSGGKGKRVSSSTPALWSAYLPTEMVPASLYPKVSERSASFCVEIKNRQSYSSISPYVIIVWCLITPQLPACFASYFTFSSVTTDGVWIGYCI
jgi:hypothetical protein